MAMPQHLHANGASLPASTYVPSKANHAPICSIDTEHNDMINDLQLDYYGKRLVTCSADRTFRVYDVSNATASAVNSPASTKPAEGASESIPLYNLTHIVELPSDSVAPIHRIAWAHPKYGSVLAVACQDGKVHTYREELQPNGNNETQWYQKHMHNFHSAAILCIAWAPYEYGLRLASASADGKISILTRLKEGWVTSSSIVNTNDSAACTSVSWAPYNSLGSQGPSGPIQRIVTGSYNGTVQIYQFSLEQNIWLVTETLQGQQECVRDVAWSPNIGIPSNVIAFSGDDYKVSIWAQDEPNGDWSSHILHTFRSPVYRLKWSLTGSMLSVAAGEDEITFWKQIGESEWLQLSSINEFGAQDPQN